MMRLLFSNKGELMSQLLDFSGGINTRVSSTLLQLNEATILNNANVFSYSLEAEKGSSSELQAVDYSFTFFNGVWVKGDYNTDYVEYQDTLYYSNGVDIPKKSSNGSTFYNLGISTPPAALTTQYTGATVLTEAPKIRQYTYTYYNSTDGSESAPVTYSDELSYEDDSVLVTGFVASSDPQVTNIKLYRLGGTLLDMFLVATLSKTATSYSDTLDDLSIAGDALTSQSGGQAPAGLKFLTEHVSMFFGAKDDKIYYSDVAYPNNWNQFFFIDFDTTITGLGSTQNGLLVFTKSKVYMITGNNPAALSKSILHGSQGCISHKTIKYVNNTLLWLSLDGICTSNGGKVDIVTLPVLGKLNVDPLCAEIYNEQYFLFHEDGTIVLDYRLGKPSVRTMDYVVYCARWLPDLMKFYYTGVDKVLRSFFTSSTPLTMHWKSGRLAEGQLTNRKTYKVFYVYIEGAITLSVYIDGVLAITSALEAGLNEVKIPQAYTYGYYVEFEATGTGSIKEIEYKVEVRQNGR